MWRNALEYPSDSGQTVTQTMSCGYCGNIVSIPAELWQPIEAAKTAQTVNQWSKYLLIFIIVVFVVPTCLGVFGTLLGVGGSIIGVIVSIIATFLPFLFQ